MTPPRLPRPPSVPPPAVRLPPAVSLLSATRLLASTAAIGGALGALNAATPAATALPPAPSRPMNVLFLVADDLRAELAIYGSPKARTPNLDKLARQGVRFERAYCQYPLCGPSRASILTGRRPTTSGLYGNREWFGASFPDWVSLPKYFRRQGYDSIRAGKIFHGGIDDTEAWTAGGDTRLHNNKINTAPPQYVPPVAARTHVGTMRRADNSRAAYSDRWEAVEGEAATQLGDTRAANRTIASLRRAKENGRPFFIACGMVKPHSPLVAPKEFFDLYRVEDMPLPPDFAARPTVPPGFPAGAIRPNNADLFINRDASPEEARAMIRAYLACVSYVDWNLGRVLDELDHLGLRENTIVVFWSDHGYQLGEKGKWSKAGSLWEQGTRVPFIIHDPRAKGNGRSSPRIVELLDIYPTLVELCGLPSAPGLEGTSLRPLLDDPAAPWDRPAYTLWNEHGKGITGIAVRTERWRYAEFFGSRGPGAMLTDPINDPHELKNLAADPRHADLVTKLHALATAQVSGKTELSAPPEK
ncbi:MAG: sulfatase [Opitutaceae bacterium]|nr:sulfatase [Opitutaceae bacterium]